MIQYCLKKQSPNSKNKELSTSDTGRPQTSGMDGSNPTTTLNENLCYPILSWQSWRYIAVNKLQITDTLAWAYFDTYLALNFENDASKRKQICDNKMRFLNYENPVNAQNASINNHNQSQLIKNQPPIPGQTISNTTKLPDGKHWHNFRSCETVPTLKFVFYLHIQQLAFDPKKSLRRSLSGENWPEIMAPGGGHGSVSGLNSHSFNEKDDIKYHRPKSKLEISTNNAPASPAIRPASSLGVYTDEMSINAGSVGGSNSSGNNDEHSAIAHIRDSIQEIFKLCSPLLQESSSSSISNKQQINSYDQSGQNGSGAGAFLSEEILDAYNVFLTCFTDNIDQQQTKFTDHLPKNLKVTESDFKNLISSKIDVSPGGITAVAEKGLAVKSWVEDAKSASSMKQNANNGSTDPMKNLKIITNGPFTNNQSKRLIITNLHDSSIIRILPENSHLYDIMIHRCDKATIYLLGNIKSLSIERCRNCTIITGAVLSTTKTSHVRNCNISVPSRSFIVSNSSDLNVNLHSLAHPVLLSQCRRIVFGPINFNFRGFDEFLVDGGLPVRSVEMFGRPLRVGKVWNEKIWNRMLVTDGNLP